MSEARWGLRSTDTIIVNPATPRSATKQIPVNEREQNYGGGEIGG